MLVYDIRRERSRLLFELRYSANLYLQFQYFSQCESLKLLASGGVSAVGPTVLYVAAENEFITDVQKTRCHGADDDHLQRTHFDGCNVRGYRRLAESYEGVLPNEKSFTLRFAGNCHRGLRVGP